MTEAAKRARAAYQREWRKRNPEKVRQYAENRWERKAAENPVSTPQNPAEPSKGGDAD